jgi:hypothetical protein
MTTLKHAAVWLPLLLPQITALLCQAIPMHPEKLMKLDRGSSVVLQGKT